MLFIGSQTEGKDEDGNLLFHPNILAIEASKPAKGYALGEEDPSIYTGGEDMDSLMPRRDGADKELLTRSAPAPALAALSDQDEMIVYCLKVHHLHADMSKSLGVDACNECEQSKIDNILSRV